MDIANKMEWELRLEEWYSVHVIVYYTLTQYLKLITMPSRAKDNNAAFKAFEHNCI